MAKVSLLAGSVVVDAGSGARSPAGVKVCVTVGAAHEVALFCARARGVLQSWGKKGEKMGG